MSITQLRNSSVFLFVVCFFFFPRLQTIFIAVSFLMVLFDKQFYSQVKEFSTAKISGLFVLYFLVVALTLLYTKNIGEGLKSLETKFAFLVFPIFLPYVFSFSVHFKEKILKLLLYSGLGYILVSFISAAISYTSTGNISAFFYGELGVGLPQKGSFVHPTYAAFFFNFLFSYVGLLLINSSKPLSKNWKDIMIIGLISLFILMLSSKFGILALGVNMVMLLVYYARKKKKIIRAIVLFAVSILFSSVLIMQTPLKVRFQSAYESLVNPSDKSSSTKTRQDVWKVTLELIGENPVLGVGTGDIRDELTKKYEEKGFDLYKQRAYDSHQQFLQTYASLGILGFFVLIALFFLFFRKAYFDNNYLFLIFTTLFFLFGLVESMLERQAGIAFFIFIGILLYSFNPIKKSI